MDPLAKSNNVFSHIFGWDKLSKVDKDKVKYFLKAFSVDSPPSDGSILPKEIELTWSKETFEVTLNVCLEAKKAKLSVASYNSTTVTEDFTLEFQVD
jgi:hypothetical protein